MGIKGLLPFLVNSTRDACISEFENEYVAVDAYCWLHKGIYSCGFELAMLKPTTKYVNYCRRYIEMLCHYNVKPILVFDGRQLSSKQETEKERREERKRKRERGKELLRAGNTEEGKKLLGESVDVTHELAVNLMKECRKRNIDCIVAPYEADAQLAFFSLRNKVKCIITEDSDLLAYGCERVMFKMDPNGNGKLVEMKNVHTSLGMTPEEFNEDKFRHLCILSGCDYLKSLTSIGPANALKFVKSIKDKNIYDALPKLPMYLNKQKLQMTSDYIEGFKIAERTFQHQLVYDPFKRMQVPLKPASNDDDIVGEKLPNDVAFQLAIGNIDPMTMTKADDYDPDKHGKGFTLLWRTDSLPNAVPRMNTSGDALVETKKRQRESFESHSVSLVPNDLKKLRISVSANSFKNSLAKSGQKVPANGFIFEPKVLVEKKDNLKEDESKLLKSRYFGLKRVGKPERKRQTPPKDASSKRKDETDEDYSRRLLEENFPEEEDKSCTCSGPSQSENQCSWCGKCPQCCCCLSTPQTESQKLDEPQPVEKTNEPEHSLLDEIYKNESEKPETPSLISHPEISSKIISEDADTGERSPSPVLYPQKTNSVSKRNFSDTAATHTSVYFSSDNTPKVSNRIGSSQRKLGPRISGELFSNQRNSVKNPTAHKTLFDFGFKKKNEVENK